MNERIEEFAKQAGLESFYVEYSPWQVEFEKFAELIVKECINISEQHAKSLEAQPCEPEFTQYEDGIVNGIYEATAAIKEHFGVQE